MKRCMGCMQSYEDDYEICPHCGYIENTPPEEALHMEPGCILHNRYIIGKVLGFGGFGVTYIGWDGKLDQKVAIKEYLPSEFSTRMPGQLGITVFNGDKGEQFKAGLDKFVDEAKRLAKFHDCDGIVKVYDCFVENGTAYIIMEYLEGETLATLLEREKKIEPKKAIEMMLPVMESLNTVHGEGLLHRDIAPDNIFITKDGNVKLIDFGASRFATTSHSRSLTVLVKPGFSAEEQYRSRGDQGTYTDVYSVAATLYKAITGVTPPDSLKRRAMYETKKKDILAPISKYVDSISENCENAILNAMNVQIQDRTQNMQKFIHDLTSGEPVKRVAGQIKRIDLYKWPLWAKIALPTCAGLVITLITLMLTGVISVKGISTEMKIPDGMTRIPAIVNMKLEDAENKLKDANLMYTIIGKEYSNEIERNKILNQDPSGGKITEKNTMLEITVSGGVEQVTVPNVVGLSKEDATSKLEEAGFKVSVAEQYDTVLDINTVISQSAESDTEYDKGGTITIVVSKGQDPNEKREIKTIVMPNFVGKNYQEVISIARTNEIIIKVSANKYSDIYSKDVVMSQSVPEGTEFSNDKAVIIEVSMGKHTEIVPDVQFKTETEANSALKGKGFTVKVTYQNSETVASGLVISQSPASGEKAAYQSEVKLVVSGGPSSFALPSVVGKTEENAKSILSNKGLKVVVTYANSDSVADGTVISQSPKEKSNVFKGNTVTITVSSGKQLITVPNVVGMTSNDAKSQLTNCGFKVSVGEEYNSTVAKGNVISQSPSSKTSFEKGATVNIIVSKGKQPVTVTFNANGGSVSETTRTVYRDSTYGTLPTPTRAYYTFNGWYTASDSGTKISASSKVTNSSNHTLYAHWTKMVLSDWVLESQVPSGAVLSGDVKYTYTLTTTTTTTNWVKTNTGTIRYVKSNEWGRGDSKPTSFPFYSTYNVSPKTASVTSTKKVEIVSDTVEKYVYWHYCRGTDEGIWANNRQIRPAWTSEFTTPHYYETTANFTSIASDGYAFDAWNTGVCKDTKWYYKAVVRKQVYNEYTKQTNTSTSTSEQTSTTYPTGNNVSNIKKWVKYYK